MQGKIEALWMSAGNESLAVTRTPPEHKINEVLYQWCVRAFSLLRKRLGINIKVHDVNGHIKHGQIFLFNHFTRFETIIPQYFIYQATSAYCRCVASHRFFESNEQFAKLLWSCGAVPNNHPGLLAFLAAEILRGRKVIFFPEGKMVKDRYVANSGMRGASMHRQGAAALALVLEAFKKRILSVYEAGESDRLDRWVKALGLPDVATLITAARQPTLVIPANITFNPIHTSDNILRKAAELFGRDISEESKAELLIESNLVFKRTDMDIRFGKAIDPHLAWNLFDGFLLNRVFERIHSLNELFALNDPASRWVDRILATTMRRKTHWLRDLCMKEMYARVTVNLNHVASRLVLSLLANGHEQIERRHFHRLLYLAFKAIQKHPEIALHRSLTNPDYYDGIHNGTSHLVQQFMGTAADSGLIEVTSGHYRFLPALKEKPNGRDPRLENIIAVYANEIAPLSTACLAIDRTIERELAAGETLCARLLFDDELRAFASCLEAYSHPRFASINEQQRSNDSGAPYLLGSEKHGNLGIVLVHDFLASPAELKKFGERLAALGYPVLGVRLRGHGTSPWDLRQRSWQEWLGSVSRGVEIMSGLAERVCIVGSALGASLGLLAAADKPAALAAVAAISPSLRFRGRSLAFVPVIHRINRLTEWAYAEEGLFPFQSFEPEHPEFTYRHVPVRGLFEVRSLLGAMERRLPDVKCRVLLQDTGDSRVDHESIAVISRKLGSAKSLQFVQPQVQGSLDAKLENSRDVTVSFLEELSSSLPSAPGPSKAEATVAKNLGTDKILRRRRFRILPLKVALPRSFAPVLRTFTTISDVSRSSAKAWDPIAAWDKSYPPGIRWQETIEPRPLPVLLDTAVKAYSDKICMSFRGRHYRYREVGRLVDHAAKGFQSLGVGKGIKVGLVLPNCPYAVICFYGVLKAGGIVVNINPLYSAGDIEQQIADSACRILVTLDAKALYEKIAGLAREGGPVESLIVCRMKGVLRFTEKLAFGLFNGKEVSSVSEDERHKFFEQLIANDGLARTPDIDPLRDVAVLQYTGGTTGFPKGAQLTHANLYVNAAQLAMWAPEIELGSEKCVAVLPLFHSFGMTGVMNLSMWIGAEMILLPKFHAAEVFQTIARERATIFIGVPTMYSALLASKEISKHQLSSLKICISGGAALSAELQHRFETMSGCKLIEGYGLSEASPVCTINPLRGGKTGSVGLPLPGTVIEIVSPENPERLLAMGEQGEICVRGPQVMLGYANRAKENIDIFLGGRLHTGDVGYLDSDGYLFIVDRIKELIISGGFNVYPRHVEEVILSHPSVEEVAVCGITDPHRGEIVQAFVKLRQGANLTAAELREFCKEKLAPFQVPRRIEFRESLPKTAVGKVSKKHLLAEVILKTHAEHALSTEMRRPQEA
jgi:acyl-CoA synthetase (AMP-forming)/AMP-acid ligase II/esterase/lipase